MKRVVIWTFGLYVLFAVIGRFVEGMGAVECGCAPDCWCKRPVLSLFRWVFPYGHRGCGTDKTAHAEAITLGPTP